MVFGGNMKYLYIIAVFCTLLAIIGTVSAETVPFFGSYGGTDVTGQITFDENGIINGGVVAGVTNGGMDVQQGSCQDGGAVVLGQYGEIVGDDGFAATLVDGGNGNQGGNLAMFTGGSMIFGQASAGGQISESGIESAREFNALAETQEAAYLEGLTIGGVVNGQFVNIEGTSGYAASGSGNSNGAYALSTASFANGRMDAIQASGSGAASLAFPVLNAQAGSVLEIPVPVYQGGVGISGAIAGQDVMMGGSSGSASTTVANSHGGYGRSAASFTNGGMDAFQVGAAGDISLTMPDLVTGTESQLSDGSPLSVTLDGVIIGQDVGMGGDSGSASTSVSNGNGDSGQTSASFTNGGMDAVQAGAAYDVSLDIPNIIYPPYIPDPGIDLTAGTGGAVVGQGVDMGGDSGSASTSVSNRNGDSVQCSASFTRGDMDAIQAGIAGDASLEVPDLVITPYIPEPGIDLTLGAGGAIGGQDVYLVGDSGSASTTVSNGNGASGQTSGSFTNGRVNTIQLAGTGDVSLGVGLPVGASSPYTQPPLSESEAVGLTVGGIFAGQTGLILGRSGSASSSVMNVDGNSAGSSATFIHNGLGIIGIDQLSAGAYLDSSSGSVLSGALSYQDISSDAFSTIAANSNSRTEGNSLSQVNAQAQGDHLADFHTTQFAGGISAGNLDIALAGQDVGMGEVHEGYASGYSSDSHGNTASVRTYVHDDGGLTVDGGSSIPSGIITGAGDIGGSSGAVVLHDDVFIEGASGGLRTEASNSIGGSAYVDATFSDYGILQSTNGPFLGMTGAALSVQNEGTNYMGAAEWNLESTSSNTNIETEITDLAKPTPATTPGTYDAYSYNLPAGLPFPNPNSEIWRHP